MAQNDYVADLSSNEVKFKGAVVATFDPKEKKVKEYLGDGENRKRWIAHAIKSAPDITVEKPFDQDSPDAFEIAIAIADNDPNEDFYSHFPNAPRPYQNFVGFKHPDIFEWMQKNYPKIVPFMYPDGPWNASAAGMEGNRTIRPVKDIQIEYLN